MIVRNEIEWHIHRAFWLKSIKEYEKSDNITLSFTLDGSLPVDFHAGEEK